MSERSCIHFIARLSSTSSSSPPTAGEQKGGLVRYEGLKRRGQNMH